MKYTTFNELLVNCKELYDEAVKKDKDLEKVFGGNTQIMTEWWSKYIENSIKIIEKEYSDKTESVDWLFWESMCNTDGYMDFEKEGVIYEGSPKNIWLDLNGILDESFSKTIPDNPDLEDKDSMLYDGSFITKEKEMDYITREDEDMIYTHKLILLKNKQVLLESVELAKRLEQSVSDDMVNIKVSKEDFVKKLENIFEKLVVLSKNKENINRINQNLNMVLMRFIGEPITQEIMDMIEFEVKNILVNNVNLGIIEEYTIIDTLQKAKLEGTILWKDASSSMKFEILLEDKIEVIFT